MITIAQIEKQVRPFIKFQILIKFTALKSTIACRKCWCLTKKKNYISSNQHNSYPLFESIYTKNSLQLHIIPKTSQ